MSCPDYLDEDSPIHDLRRKDDKLEAQNQLILEKLTVIEARQQEFIELITLFKTTKGFITGVRTIGVLVMWLSGIGSAFALIGYAIKHWVRGG